MNTPEAFGKTIAEWAESRAEDFNLLCEEIDLDTVDFEIDDGKISADPAIDSVGDCVKEFYWEFLKDWEGNLRAESSQVGPMTDFLIGLTKRRR